MDFREQLAALFLGNAPHEDTIGATAVEIPFYHRVAFSQSDYALSGHIVISRDGTRGCGCGFGENPPAGKPAGL